MHQSTDQIHQFSRFPGRSLTVVGLCVFQELKRVRTEVKDMSQELELSKMDLKNLHSINVGLCEDISANEAKVKSSILSQTDGFHPQHNGFHTKRSWILS